MNGKSGGFLAVALVIGGLVLLSDPQCKHGCRTVAQHLITIGGESLLGG